MSSLFNMSTRSTITTESNEQNFTRGEKCLFTHLVVTVLIILVLIIAYFIHLCLVHHSLKDIFKICVPLTQNQNNLLIDVTAATTYLPVGRVYITIKPIKTICNTLLLRPKWSVAPAHCTTMRSHPDMLDMLQLWKVMYQTVNFQYIESDIKRSIPHPHFNRDDFSNNIGLFEHLQSIDACPYYAFPTTFMLNDEIFQDYANNMMMVGWERDLSGHQDRQIINKYPVRSVTFEKCRRFVSPLVELRSYEFCLMFGQDGNAHIEHGALLLMDSNIVGIFSWGEKHGKGVPFIIINLINHKTWLEEMASL